MEEGKVRKVWRLYFLVPLPTQPSQQAAGSATQESQTQIPFPQEQPSITWVLSSALLFLMAMLSEGLRRFPKGNPTALWLVLFSSCLQSCSALGFGLRSHSFQQDHVCMGVLQGKHRCTRKWFCGSKLTLLPLRDRLKAGDFFPPWTSIAPEPMWCSVYTSGL